MKTNTKVVAVCIIAATVLLACSNQKVVTPLVSLTSFVTSTPILISTSTHMATAVSTPTMTPTIVVFSSQFCMGAVAPWSCSCGDLSYQYLQIKNSSQTGLCDVSVLLDYYEVDAYSITLPDNWFCSVVGAASNNLRCISDSNQKLFLQSLTSELPITQAGEAVSIFQEGGGYWSNPIVEADELQLSQELVTIGDKQVLKLVTSQKDSFILRYFMKRDDSLYVLRFEMKDPDAQENRETILILEDIVQSMRFLE